MISIITGIIKDSLNPVLNLIDKSKFTKQEKAEIKLELAKLENNILKKSNDMNLLDAKSENKFRSFARPAFLWLFYGFIGVSLPMGLLNYFHNDLYLAILDGMSTYLSIVVKPYMIYAFTSLLGVNHTLRTIEKIKGVKK